MREGAIGSCGEFILIRVHNGDGTVSDHQERSLMGVILIE